MDSLSIFTKWKVPALSVPDIFLKRTNGKINYKDYRMEGKEELLCLAEGFVIVGLFSYFFYRSVWAFFFLSPAIIFYRREKKKSLSAKRIENLEKQFKETILSVYTNLQAGYSMENAFLESYQDVVRLFGSSSDMAKELMLIRKGLSNGIPLGKLLWDLSNRCGEGEIAEFAEVFGIASQTGGKWKEVMKKTVNLIQEKIELKEEIATLIHARQMESRIMSVIPFLILFYINLTSPGYFDVLYHNLAGILIMTVCMVLYCVAYYWIAKITEISL